MDQELEVLSKINGLISGLDQEAKMRVLTWIVNKHNLTNSPTNSPTVQKQATALEDKLAIENTEIISDLTSYTSPAELLAKSNAGQGPERVLVISAYLQQKSGQEVTAFDVNKVLKDIGYAINNGISHTFDSLMSRKPQLMVQTKKNGNSRQSKKLYKVTDEGFKKVFGMLGPQKNSE
jgi:hypothetical protein